MIKIILLFLVYLVRPLLPFNWLGEEVIGWARGRGSILLLDINFGIMFIKSYKILMNFSSKKQE